MGMDMQPLSRLGSLHQYCSSGAETLHIAHWQGLWLMAPAYLRSVRTGAFHAETLRRRRSRSCPSFRALNVSREECCLAPCNILRPLRLCDAAWNRDARAAFQDQATPRWVWLQRLRVNWPRARPLGMPGTCQGERLIADAGRPGWCIRFAAESSVVGVALPAHVFL